MRFKKIVLSAICVLSMIIGTPAIGQNYTTSARHAFKYIENSDTAITRCYKDTILVTCTNQKINDIVFTTSFIIRNESSSTAKTLWISRFYNEYGRISFNITDMHILNGICYFCGTQTTPIGYGEEYNSLTVNTSVGFVGHFSIDDVLSETGNYYLETFNEVSSFSKMAVTDKVDSGDVGIMIIGTRNDEPSNTCLTCLVQPHGSNQWKYYVTDSDIDDEVFTDVIVTDGLWVTASLFENNKKLIGFRSTKIGNTGFYRETFYNTPADLFQFDITTHLRIDRCTDSPLLLCPMYDDHFSAGFSGYPIADPNLYRLFDNTYIIHMDYPNHMSQLHTFNSPGKSMIKDLTYIPDIQSTVVLYQSRISVFDTTRQNYLIRTNWNNSEEYCDTVMYLDYGKLLSLDFSRSDILAMGAIWDQYHPSDVLQRVTRRQNSCLNLNGCHTIFPTNTTTSIFKESQFQWVYSIREKDWKAKEFNAIFNSAAPYCVH